MLASAPVEAIDLPDEVGQEGAIRTAVAELVEGARDVSKLDVGFLGLWAIRIDNETDPMDQAIYLTTDAVNALLKDRGVPTSRQAIGRVLKQAGFKYDQLPPFFWCRRRVWIISRHGENAVARDERRGDAGDLHP